MLGGKIMNDLEILNTFELGLKTVQFVADDTDVIREVLRFLLRLLQLY